MVWLLLGLCCLPPSSVDDGPRSLDEAIGKPPMAMVDDPTFLRRASIDLIGRIPSVPEVRTFLDDRSPSKRSARVESLVASDEFADYWGRLLAEWLTGRRPVFRPDADGQALAESLARAIRQDRSYPQIVRDLVAGKGASDENGLVNYLLSYEADPVKLAGGLGKTLMGTTIQCAQCHDHPSARWRQEDFWGLAATFARVRRFRSEQDGSLLAIHDATRGELRRPDPSAPAGTDLQPTMPVRPSLPDGTRIAADANRREALGDWLASADNPYVARNLINRAWDHFVGKALVKDLNDPGRKSATTATLDFLAADFARSNHSIQALARTIATSQTYAQSPGVEANSWDRPNVRPIALDPLYASIAQATGYQADPPPIGDDENGDSADDETDDDVSTTEAAAQRTEADLPVERLGERSTSLQRALIFMNGDHLREAVRSGSRVCQAVLGPKIGPAHLEWAFLATLGRKPTADESGRMAKLLTMARDRREGLEDVFWVLLNTVEFQTNH